VHFVLNISKFRFKVLTLNLESKDFTNELDNLSSNFNNVNLNNRNNKKGIIILITIF